jgi:hypothetical protein
MKKTKKVVKRVTKLRPRKRVRRNPMARALEVAEAKHKKAVVDWAKCIERIAFLKVEIPRLEDVIRVLGGSSSRTDVGATEQPTATNAASQYVEDQGVAIQQYPLTERKATGPVPAAVAVPTHLQHMIKEHPLVVKGTGGALGAVQPFEFPDE